MNSVYNYKENIKKLTTPNGDKVITMSEEIYTVLCNTIFEAYSSYEKRDLKGTAKDTLELWTAIAEWSEDEKESK